MLEDMQYRHRSTTSMDVWTAMVLPTDGSYRFTLVEGRQGKVWIAYDKDHRNIVEQKVWVQTDENPDGQVAPVRDYVPRCVYTLLGFKEEHEVQAAHKYYLHCLAERRAGREPTWPDEAEETETGKRQREPEDPEASKATEAGKQQAEESRCAAAALPGEEREERAAGDKKRLKKEKKAKEAQEQEPKFTKVEDIIASQVCTFYQEKNVQVPAAFLEAVTQEVKNLRTLLADTKEAKDQFDEARKLADRGIT